MEIPENAKLLQEKQLEEKYLYEEFYHKKGQMKSEGSQLEFEKRQMAKPEYRDIESRVIDLKMQQMVYKQEADNIMDMHNAIESGLMEYHHEKMKEINLQLADFWKMTYKGNDIDSIQIKSDQEKDTKSARMRSYNYRVALTNTEGIEMDMKGRCSAGQRVLSSIIIRLALAETFCQNCGILALDEPTTNLDAENIGGLVTALEDIIEARKQ